MGEKAVSALVTSLTFLLPFYSSDTSEVKSLDLLAALPTPPHNQTEDVRWGQPEMGMRNGSTGPGQVVSSFLWPMADFKSGYDID